MIISVKMWIFIVIQILFLMIEKEYIEYSVYHYEREEFVVI